MMVFAIMIMLMIARIEPGVSGEITIVNKLKKNSVALGFKAFVKKPILIAERAEMSSFLVSWPTSKTDDFDKMDFTPM